MHPHICFQQFGFLHVWISKLHLGFLNFEEILQINFLEQTKRKFPTKIHHATTTLTVGIQRPKVGPVGPTSQANGQLPLFLRQRLVGPTGQFWPLWVHYLSQPAERGNSTPFQYIFIPSTKFALKFIQALIVSLKFKYLVAYIQVALVKLTGGWNSSHF